MSPNLVYLNPMVVNLYVVRKSKIKFNKTMSMEKDVIVRRVEANGVQWEEIALIMLFS